VAHDGLPETVEAMLQVCGLPIGPHKPRWQLLVLMVISAVAAVVQSLAELYADGVDAVQVVEHVRPARKAVSFQLLKKQIAEFIFPWAVTGAYVLEMVLVGF